MFHYGTLNIEQQLPTNKCCLEFHKPASIILICINELICILQRIIPIMIRSTSMSISSLDQLWSPRQFSANGKGQTPLEVGSWDYYFCSDQSQETNWKLKITSDTNTSSIVKVRSLSYFYLTKLKIRSDTRSRF